MLASAVPEWAKEPDLVARMVDGEACRNEDEPGSPYYIAKRVLGHQDQTALAAAVEKRERRNHIRLLHKQPQGESRVLH